MSNLRIDSPCAAEWNAMRPVSGGRHCSLCAQKVIDLTCLAPAARDTEMARITARIQAGERVCIRAPATRDGRLLSQSRRILSGGMAALLAMTMAGCQGSGPDTDATATNLEKAAGTTVGATPIVPCLKGEVQAEQAMLGKVKMDDVMVGAIAAEPAQPTTPVAPHAAQ